MIIKPVERFLAFRYLRARRAEGFISVIAWFSFLGITLGVATLVIVMSVMNGFRAELIDRILGLNGHIGVFKTDGRPIEKYNEVSFQLSEIPSIVAATPQIQGQVMATSSRNALGAVVRGVVWSDLAARKPLWDSLSQQAIAGFRDGGGILIGKTMAFQLGVKPGDQISLLSAKGRTTAFGSVPTRRTYKIAGLFKVGMHEYDSSFVFMPLSAAQSFFTLPDAVTGIELYSSSPLQIERVSAAVKARLGQSYRLFDWQERNRTFINALQVERNVMFLILTLIIVVAAFNIVSSMIMLVRSKNADIAVLRSMGASSAADVLGSTLGLGSAGAAKPPRRQAHVDQRAPQVGSSLRAGRIRAAADDITMDEYQSHVANARLVLDGLLESDEDLYDYAWDMVLETPSVYRDQAWGEGDYDNEVVYHDCII